MADRDFAQLQATVKPEAGGASTWRASMLVAGIISVVIMSFAGGYWLGGRNGHDPLDIAAKAKLLAQLQQQQKQLKALRRQISKAKVSPVTVPSMAMDDLTFYTDLPKQSVKPEPLSQPDPTAGIPSSAKATSPSSPSILSNSASVSVPGNSKSIQMNAQPEMDATPAMGKGLFYVQAASFRDMKAVSDMQHKLQAMDMNTVIKRVNVPGKGIWYRLLVGPFVTRGTANSARVNLVQKMHLKGIVISNGG